MAKNVQLEKDVRLEPEGVCRQEELNSGKQPAVK
jgi:hypothetical protein